MNRLSLIIFTMISLGAVSLGANNSFGIRQAQEGLSDRAGYCEFARVQGGKQTWADYRQKKIKFENLPEFMSLHLADSENQLQTRLKQLQHSIHLLTEQKQKLSRVPASAVVDWKLKTEIPQQLKQLQKEYNILHARYESLQKREFSEQEMSNTYLEAKEEAFSSESIPLLGFEVDYEDSIFGDEVQLLPVWVDGLNEEEWKITQASSEPLLKLKKSMIPADLKIAFEKKNLPPYFQAYSKLLKPPSPPLESVRWKYLASNRLILINSPNTHLAVQAVLDLACLK